MNNEPLINDENDGDDGEDGNSTIEDVPILSPFSSLIVSNENNQCQNENPQKRKKFPTIQKTSWTLAYNYMFKNVFICNKNEHKDILNTAYEHGKYTQINWNLDDFVELFESVHLIEI